MRLKLYLFFCFLLSVTYLSAQSFQYIVSKDNSSKYHSIQEVLNAIPSGNTNPVKIFVKAGVYHEVVVVDASKSNITLIGEDVNTTIINFNNILKNSTLVFGLFLYFYVYYYINN